MSTYNKTKGGSRKNSQTRKNSNSRGGTGLGLSGNNLANKLSNTKKQHSSSHAKMIQPINENIQEESDQNLEFDDDELGRSPEHIDLSKVKENNEIVTDK